MQALPSNGDLADRLDLLADLSELLGEHVDSHDHGIEIRNLPNDLEPGRALAGDDIRVIEAIDVGEPFFLRDFVRARFRVGKFLSEQHDVCAQFLTVADFDQWRELRHHHRRGHAQQFPLISKRLSMIPGGGGDHALLFLRRRKFRKGIMRAAFLEAAGALKVVEFAENLHPGELAERDRLGTGRLVNGAFNALGGSFDIGESDQRKAA